MHWNIETEREDDGRWIAEIPAVPGVIVYGRPGRGQRKAYALALQVIADDVENSENVPCSITSTAFPLDSVAQREGEASLQSQELLQIGWIEVSQRGSHKKLRHTSGTYPMYVWSYGDSDELGSKIAVEDLKAHRPQTYGPLTTSKYKGTNSLDSETRRQTNFGIHGLSVLYRPATLIAKIIEIFPFPRESTIPFGQV